MAAVRLDGRTRRRDPRAALGEFVRGFCVPQTLVQTKRLLVRWGRDLSTVIQTLVVPDPLPADFEYRSR